MCGRYTLTRPGREVREVFALGATPAIEPRYNIAPSQEALVVRRSDGGGRRADRAIWGFGGGERRLLINARAETVAEKPSFRDSYDRRRCLVPADGFYEWRRERGRSRPFLFSVAGGGLLAFGGLWKPTLDYRGQAGLVFTILTVDSNELVGRIHPRMPLIVPPSGWDLWLDPGTRRAALAELALPYPADEMRSREVSTAVNDVARDSPECWLPPEPPDAVQLDLLT